MQDINELKNIVIQSFESKGILSQIRAQIRASVFKAIEENEEEGDIQAFDWENTKALKIKDNQELVILCKLFENFLTFYDLDYTENVFKHEVNDKINTEEILEKIGIDLSDKSQPFIFQLFNQPRKSNFLKNKNPLEDKIDQLPTPKIENQKKVAKIVSNKTQEKKSFDNDSSNKKQEIINQKSEFKKPTVSDFEQNFTEEQESQNDIFLSQSVGLDITVDSKALEQFDYDESVEDINN